MTVPWFGSAAFSNECKYGRTVPGGSMISKSSVFEYDNSSPSFFASVLFVSSDLPSLWGDTTGVFELSVQYMYPLSPPAHCLPRTVFC